MRSLMFMGELALRALLLGSVGLLAAWIFQRRGAETQHAIWRIVLSGMFAMPVLIAFLPPLAILPEYRVVSTMPFLPTSIAPSSAVPVSLALPSGSSESSVPKRGIPRTSWPMVLLAAYGAIAVLLLSRTVKSALRAKRVAAVATRVFRDPVEAMGYPRPELRESAGVSVPFTIGWRDPIIVLPKGWREWDDFKLQSVLAHEMAHIRRADWATALAAALNRAVFWYHPLAWWLERRLSALGEEACDASAIRSTGDELRYARIVLEFAGVASRKQVLLATSMARTSQVSRRIAGIIQGRVAASHAISGFAGVLMLAVALPAMYGAAALGLAGTARPLVLAQETSSPSFSQRAIDNQALLAEGWRTKPEDVAALEAKLAAEPENLALRSRLLSYYTQYIIPEQRTTHLLWLIEHHPEAEVVFHGSIVTSIAPTMGLITPANAERARALWVRQAEKFRTNTKVLANAAVALASADPRTSLNLVRQARALEPQDPEWVDWLAGIYARAVRSSFAGGPEKIRSFTRTGKDRVWQPFMLPLFDSESLKSELETSRDTDLVGCTGEALVAETSNLRRFALARRDAAQEFLRLPQQALLNQLDDQEVPASEAFGKLLLARARELDPKNPRWQH